ncbi:MAG: hemagglutinin repeat-containing protein, partial [Alcanivoracaceae bacterium]|nr:hemagglutinin repeat-containing protein [Alcanivoracaceae bacterium]
WGISCDGCGFINTGRATLTTGTPVIAEDGRLRGFDVQGGAVDISGAGINASNIDRFDIITRSLALNAALHGQEVNLVLGKQQVAYADLAVTDVQTDDDAPTLALDSTALGGIYADRIRLLSSEQGVGVKLSAPIAAQTGNVTLDVNGNLRFNNITSGGDLDVTAVSVQTGNDAADAVDETPATTRLLSGGHIDIATEGEAELDNTLLLAGNGINVQAGTDLRASNSEMRTVRDIGLQASDTLQLDANSKLVTNAELSLDAQALDGWQQASLNADHLNVSSVQDLVLDQEMSLRGDATLSTEGALDISGGIYLPGTLHVNAASLHNSGDVIAYGDLAISADSATNLGLWYSGGDMVVDIVSRLVNGDADHAAAIYSAGALQVRASQPASAGTGAATGTPEDIAPASTLVNTGSLIQAQGAMTLDVENILNLREGEAYSSNAELEVIWLKRTKHDRHEQRITTTTEYIVEEGRGAEVISGGDMTIQGDIENRMSLFYANGDIDITGDVENEDLVMRRYISDIVYDWDYKTRWGKRKFYRDKKIEDNSRIEDTGEVIFSTVYATGDIYLNGEKIENRGTPEATAPVELDERQLALVPARPDISLHDGVQSGAIINDNDIASLIGNALFSVNTDPDHPYLIESRHAFADWQGFHGSDYMLQRVGWTADGTVKLLGDEFAELTLARQQIVAMTGRPLISAEYEDEVQQYSALVKNGLYAAEAQELSPGVSLTAEQINALTADIVWPEKKVIAGVEVMVPVLYLAVDESELDVNGAIIAATNIYIDGDTIHNTGVLDARENITVDGNNIMLGGDVHAGNEIDVSAESSLVLRGVDMQAQDISLASAGDLTIETYADYNERDIGGGKAWETLLGRQAAIDAANNLTITSGHDINLYGANLSGNSVHLDAGGSVLLGAVRSSDGLNVKGDNSHLKTDRVRYTVSTINSVLDTLISAEENIKALGADIEAGGDIALYADGDVELLAVMNSDFRYERKDLDRAYGSKIKTREDYEQSADVVTLKSGGNVLLNAKIDPLTGKLVTNDDAKGNVVIQGAEIASEETTAVYAGNELYVTAAVEESYHHRETRREYDSWASETAGAVGAVASAFGPAYTLATGQEASFELKGGHSAGATSQALRDTLFSGAGNTVLLAGEGVTLEAGDYKGDNLFISSGLNEGSTASTQILGLQTTNSQYRTETDYLFGQSQGFASMSTRATEDAGRYSADTLWHGTAIDITDNVSINSAGNVILQGTTLEAGGDINMFAGGGIVFDTGYSSSSYSETLASDANLGEYLNTERNTSRSFAEVTSLSAGGAINITSEGDQIYVGTELQSGDDITLTSHDGAVKFEAARDTASTSYTEQSSDFSWVTMKSEGSYDEVLRMVSLQPGGNLVIKAADGISVDIEKIDGKTGPALVDALVTRNPEMAWLKDLADQGEIDWNEVEAVHERWSEEQESLGAGASAFIA